MQDRAADGTEHQALLFPTPKYPIESVDNALRLLLLLRDREVITVQECSRSLGVAPSTAHRLLAMLQHYGFAEQETVTRAYRSGPVLADMGLKALRELDLREITRGHIERLSAAVGETVHLVTLRGATVLFIDCVEGERALRAASRVGQVLPAHATAAGKAILATLANDELDALFPDATLSRLTDATITSRDELLEELRQVRVRGYAINDGQSEPGLLAVASSIDSRMGSGVRAAFTVAAPAARVDDQRLDAIASAVRSAADEAGESLSH